MKQRKGLELLRHMVRQIEARNPNASLERLRFSCSIEIAEEIAGELLELDHDGRLAKIIRARRKRAQAPLQPGDHVYGTTIVNVFNAHEARGLAWVAT